MIRIATRKFFCYHTHTRAHARAHSRIVGAGLAALPIDYVNGYVYRPKIMPVEELVRMRRCVKCVVCRVLCHAKQTFDFVTIQFPPALSEPYIHGTTCKCSLFKSDPTASGRPVGVRYRPQESARDVRASQARVVGAEEAGARGRREHEPAQTGERVERVRRIRLRIGIGEV